MDRIEAMSLLLDTLDAGSFSAAARRRGIPVTTLTRKIGQLERHLRSTLLIRSTRSLVLTDAGERYAAGARAIVAQLREIEREAAGEFVEPTGRLTVSAPRMFGRLHVLPIIAEFLDQHSGITVDLLLGDGNIDLLAGAADLAIRIGALPDSSLIATRLGNMRLVTAASPELVRRYGEPDSPDALSLLPRVVLNIPLPETVATLAQWRSPGTTRLIVSSAEAAVDAARAGIGAVRVLHYQVAAAVRAGELRILLAEHEQDPAPVHVMHPSSAQMPLKTRRFLDHVADRLKVSLLAISSGE